MPIALFILGRVKALADLAIVFLSFILLQIGAPAGARGPPFLPVAAGMRASTENNKEWACRDPGSNRGPSDLQADALPTELSRRTQFCSRRTWLLSRPYA
jgi:hypothetical protein